MFRIFFISLNIIIFLGIGNSVEAQQGNPDSERFVYEATRTGSFADGVFVYKDSNTSVSGKFLEGTGGGCDFSCAGGTNIDLNTSFQYGPFSAGHPGLVNGRLYKNIYFSGFAILTGGNYTFPYRWTRGRFTVVLPATLNAQLNFHSENFNYQNPTVPFYRKQVNLQGTVKLMIEMTGIGPNPKGKDYVPFFRVINFTYDFSNNSQTNNENTENVEKVVQ